MSGWRDAVRPVPDSDLPHLGGQMATGARALGALSAILVVVFAAVEIGRGAATPGRAAVAGALEAGGFFLVWLAAGTAWGRRHGDILLLCFVLHVIASISAVPWVMRDGTNPYLVVPPTLPILMAAFVPWRPTFSLLVAALCAVLPLAVASHVDGSAADHPLPLVTLALCFGTSAAGANQLHRRLWRQLERARSQLVAVARTCALGEMTAGIAHELKTPVAAALNDLSGAKALVDELDQSIGHRDVNDEDLRAISREMTDTLGRVEQAVSRAARFVQAIRAQTIHTDETLRTTFSLGEAAGAVLPLFEHRVRKDRVRIELDPAMDGIVLSGVPQKLEQILVNLVGNALDACVESGQGSRVRVSGALVDGGVVVVVEDDGPGVPKALERRIFDPLFTTRAAREGTGLGLSIARDIAEAAFGGSLRLAPSDVGARFELHCPDLAAVSLRRVAWTPAVVDAMP